MPRRKKKGIVKPLLGAAALGGAGYGFYYSLKNPIKSAAGEVAATKPSQAYSGKGPIDRTPEYKGKPIMIGENPIPPGGLNLRTESEFAKLSAEHLQKVDDATLRMLKQNTGQSNSYGGIFSAAEQQGLGVDITRTGGTINVEIQGLKGPTQVVQLPAQPRGGGKATFGLRRYNAPTFIVGERGAERIGHVQDAIEESIFNAIKDKKNLTPTQFADVIQNARQEVFDILPASTNTDYRGFGQTIESTRMSNRIVGTRLQRELSTLDKIHGTGVQAEAARRGFRGIKTRADLYGAVISDYWQGMSDDVLKNVGISTNRTSPEFYRQVMSMYDNTKGGNMIKGIGHRSVMGKSAIVGTPLDKVLHEGGRILRSGNLVNPESGQIAKTWNGIKDGMISNFPAGPEGIRALNTGANNRLIGTTSRAAFIVDPKAAAVLGFDPFESGGSFRVSKMQKDVLTQGIHTRYNLDVRPGSPGAPKGIDLAIKKQKIVRSGNRGKYDKWIGGLSQKEQRIVGGFDDPLMTFGKGQLVGSGSIEFIEDGATRSVSSRNIRTRGTYDVTNIGYNAIDDTLSIQGHMRASTAALTIGGSHASMNPHTFSASKLGDAMSGGNVHILGSWTDLKKWDQMGVLFDDLAVQIEQGGGNAVKAFSDLKTMNLKTYNQTVKKFGLESKIDYISKKGEIRLKTTTRDAKEIALAAGYTEAQAAGITGQIEMANLASKVTIGGEASFYSSKGVWSNAYQEGTSLAHRRLGKLNEIQSVLQRGDVEEAKRMIRNIGGDKGKDIFASERKGYGEAFGKLGQKNIDDRSILLNRTRGLIQSAEKDINVGLSKMNTISNLKMGFDESIMLGLTANKSYKTLSKIIQGEMVKQSGSAGRELRAYMGQMGMGTQGNWGIANVGALQTKSGPLTRVKIGSSELKELGSIARNLEKQLSDGSPITQEMFDSVNKKFNDALGRVGVAPGESMGGFLLETNGMELPVAIGSNPVKVGGQQGQIYIPGINEAVPQNQMFQPGGYSKNKILLRKLKLYQHLGMYPNEAIVGKRAMPGLAENWRLGTGKAMGDLYDELNVMSTSKKGGGRRIMGQEWRAEASIYSQAIGQGQIDIQDRMMALSGSERQRIQGLKGTQQIEALDDALANTIFISKEQAKLMPDDIYQAIKSGKGYGITGRWPIVSPGGIGVTRFAIAESLHGNVAGVSSAGLMRFAGDVDMDKVAAFVGRFEGNAEAQKALEEAYSYTLKQNQMVGKYINNRINDMNIDDISNEFLADLQKSYKKDFGTQWDDLIKETGSAEGALRKALSSRAATQTMTGGITNKLRQQFMFLAEGGADDLVAQTAADVMGLSIIESPIMARKSGTGSLVGEELIQMMEAGDSDALARKIRDVGVAKNLTGEQLSQLTGEQSAYYQNLAKQTKVGAAQEGFAWGEVARQEGDDFLAMAQKGSGAKVGQGYQDVAELLVRTSKESQEIFRGSEKFINKVRLSLDTLDPEEFPVFLQQIASDAEKTSPLQRQMAAAMISQDDEMIKALSGYEQGMTKVVDTISPSMDDMLESATRAGVGKDAESMLNKIAQTKVGEAIQKAIQNHPGKMVAAGAAAVVGLYALSHMFGSSPPAPPSYEDGQPGGRSGTGDRPAYLRGDTQQQGRNFGYNTIIEGNTESTQHIRSFAQKGQMSIRDNSMSDMQFRHAMGQASTSKFGY